MENGVGKRRYLKTALGALVLLALAYLAVLAPTGTLSGVPSTEDEIQTGVFGGELFAETSYSVLS